MRREAKIPYHRRAHLITMGRERYRGKRGARACTLGSKRRKAAALTARMKECLEYLGDPRDSMTLEEKKKIALFYFFSQVNNECVCRAAPKPLYQARESSLVPFHLLTVHFLQKMQIYKAFFIVLC